MFNLSKELLLIECGCRRLHIELRVLNSCALILQDWLAASVISASPLVASSQA